MFDSHLLCLKDVIEGVAVFFQPKFIGFFDISKGQLESGEWIILSCVHDNRRIIFSLNRPGPWSELSGKPIIPALEAEMGLPLITDKIIVIDLL